MRALVIELRKEKRTGVIPVLLAVGILGAAYAFVNFLVRKDTLLNLPLAPMDVLLTQLYGMIMILNLFGIVVAACMVFHLEFKGSAVKNVYASHERTWDVSLQIPNPDRHALCGGSSGKSGTDENRAELPAAGDI